MESKQLKDIMDGMKKLRNAIEDYMDSGALCFIEWPENVEELLPGDVVNVNITVHEDGSRTLSIDN